METRTKAGIPVWRDSRYVCALADDERHFGHILKTGDWIAFDATHPGENGAGIRQLGAFSSMESAKAAVERAIAPQPAQRTMRVSSAGSSIQ
jgi:hypothetical protein